MATITYTPGWLAKAISAVKTFLKSEPVPCWFDYLQEANKK